MSFEGQAIFYSDQNLVAAHMDGQRHGNYAENDHVEKDQAFMKYMHFVLEFQDKNTYIYRYGHWKWSHVFLLEYREQLQTNAGKGQYFLKVDLNDLVNFDESLATMLRNFPS